MSDLFKSLEEQMEEYRSQEEQKKKDSIVYRVKCFISDHNYFTSYRWKENPIRPRNLKLSLQSVWFFRKVIWDYRPWDFGYTMKVWEKTLEAQQKDFEKGHIGNHEKYEFDIKMARCLLNRMIKEDYYDLAKGEFCLGRTRDWALQSDKLRQQDLELFCDLLKRHSKKWWT